MYRVDVMYGERSEKNKEIEFLIPYRTIGLSEGWTEVILRYTRQFFLLCIVKAKSHLDKRIFVSYLTRDFCSFYRLYI